MPAITCSPSVLKNAVPCLNCFSQKELKAIIVYAFGTTAGLTRRQIEINAKTYRDMSKKDMLVALTEMIANQLVPTLSAGQLRAAIRCNGCASDKALEAEMLYLFCAYFQSKIGS